MVITVITEEDIMVIMDIMVTIDTTK